MKTEQRSLRGKSMCATASRFLFAVIVVAIVFQRTGAAGEAAEVGSSAPVELAEVIVTAQRVESDLQHTPVAVTEFSQTVLEERNVTNLSDLSGLAPNLQIGSRSGGAGGMGEVILRGMGINSNPPASPAVGLYIDEVYYPAAFGNLLGVFDVDSIQVLRGPQGTQFGRNTVGGAVLYTSKAPQLGTVGGYAELTGGNQGHADAQGAVNLPIGQQVAVRLSGALLNEAGYVHDDLNDIERGSQHARQARLQVRADVSDRFGIDFKLEDVEVHNNGPASIVKAFDYASPSGVALGGAPVLARFVSPNNYEDAGFNSPALFTERFRLAQLTAHWQVTDDIIFKSISAYSVSDTRLEVDQDYTPLNLLAVTRGIVTDELFTQEFRLSGNSFGKRLHWSGGVYFYGEHNKTDGEDASFFGSPPANPFGDNDISTQSYALYGQATYDLTQQLALAVGLRYTDEEEHLGDGGLPPLLPYYAQKASYNNKAPMVGLNYQVNPNLLLYVKDSQGFRAGGFSPTVASGNAFNEETAKTIEAGARWELLDHRLRINPTLFYTHWDDIQFNSIGPCGCFLGLLPFIQNAGDATVKGAELEIQAAITEELSLIGSFAYLDSHYSNIAGFLTATNAISPSTPLERAPKTSFSLAPTYTLPLPNGAALSGNLGYTWQAEQRSATTNQDNVEISSYGLLNGRLTYRAMSDRWSVALWAKNLTDKAYAIGGTNYSGGPVPTIEADVGRPREYGVTGRYNF